MKAIGYVRVSTDKQADEGISLSTQEAQIRQYAKLYDMQIVQVISDEGQSAKTLERPGIKRILHLLDSGTADGVVVTKLDRLTRSVFDLGYLLTNYMSKYRFCSVHDKFDTDTASGRMILSILTTVSQWEREVISERTKSALQHKKANGERTGTIPYGKRLAPDGTYLIKDTEEQWNIGQIRMLRDEGYTYQGIINVLSNMGSTNRKGKPFTLSAIHKIANMENK